MAKLYAGDRFPDFEFHTAKGETLSVSKVLQLRGKTIFWVLRYIGCTTCRYDIQLISDRYQKFLDLDAQVFIVLQSQQETVQEEMARAEGAGQGLSPNLEIICDPGFDFYERFSIEAAPDKERLRPSDPDGMTKLAIKKEKVKAAGIIHGKYEGNEMQLPAFFIVDRNGIVLRAHYAKNNIDMPTPDEALEELRK
jgi:peroxiredoxin